MAKLAAKIAALSSGHGVYNTSEQRNRETDGQTDGRTEEKNAYRVQSSSAMPTRDRNPEGVATDSDSGGSLSLFASRAKSHGLAQYGD